MERILPVRVVSNVAQFTHHISIRTDTYGENLDVLGSGKLGSFLGQPREPRQAVSEDNGDVSSIGSRAMFSRKHRVHHVIHGMVGIGVTMDVRDVVDSSSERFPSQVVFQMELVIDSVAVRDHAHPGLKRGAAYVQHGGDVLDERFDVIVEIHRPDAGRSVKDKHDVRRSTQT